MAGRSPPAPSMGVGGPGGAAMLIVGGTAVA